MRILVDQDEVMVRWLDPILEEYNRIHNTTFTEHDILTWDIEDTLPDCRDLVDELLNTRHFYERMPPMEGAIEGMKKLIDRKYDVVIATSTPKWAPIAYEGKVNWLKRYMPFFPLDNLVSIKRKELLTGDVLLDDKPENVMRFCETGRLGVLFNRPSNLVTNNPHISRYDRVHSWEEFLFLIETL